MQTVTVTINDVNDPPAPNQNGVVVITKAATDEDPQEDEVMQDLEAAAGTGVVQMTLDLDKMFSDEDGDTNFRYHLENGPDWLQLVNVQYGDDGSVTGQLVGTVPAGIDTSAFDVMLVATDQDGARGAAVFNIIVDDGNDDITDINLTNPDGTANAFQTVDIPENAAGSGFVIGTLTADDQDNPRHPNGMHTFEVAPAYAENFEIVMNDDGEHVLKVKDDAMLNFEDAATIGVQVTAKDGGGKSRMEVVTVNVMDNNDAPTVLNEPGNWWVTVDEDLDADEVTAGQWLTFGLETQGGTPADLRPLFGDVDADDTLTYTKVSGPAWLEINEDTGVMTNAKEMMPERGVYDVTIRATDKAGESAEASFQIAVVLSDDENADNDEPDIKSDGIDINENSPAGTVVATITIEDEDLDVAGIHPWGDLTIVVEATATVDGTADTELQTAAQWMNTNPNDDFLALELVSQDDDSVTYNIVLTGNTGTQAIDYEMLTEVELTVTAYDGTVTAAFDAIDNNTDGADIAEFDFEIEDVNEAPAFVNAEAANNPVNGTTNLAATAAGISYTVQQQQDPDTDSAVHTIYLNLSRLFEDPDEDHDDDDYSFTASLNGVPWLKMASHWNEDTESMTSGPVKWEDIKDGRDEDDGTDDDLTWGPGAGNVGDDDYVLILEVDRNGMDGDPAMADASEIGQDMNGLITIVATDEDGARSSTNIAVNITDENLAPRADGSEVVGVRISDTTPHEKDTITITFDENVDPDFTGPNEGSPVAVIYQVINDEGATVGGAETIVHAGVDNTVRYTVKQSDVGDTIQGKVVYFELFDGNIVASETDNAALEANTGAVADRQDPATGTITFSTTGATLSAAVNIMDPDGYTDVGDDNIPDDATYTWQWSDNGRGGWQTFDADGDDATPDADDTNVATITGTDAQGKYVRLVVTFDDANGVTERVTSEAIKVGTIATVATPPTIAGGTTDIPVGRTLRIDLESSTPARGSAEAEWIDNATGVVLGTGTEYTVTEADRGKMIAVRITSKDATGNVTSIVSTTAVTAVAAPTNSGPIAPEANHIIDLGAAPDTEGELVSLTTTVNMASLFEDIEGGLTFVFANPTNFGADSVGGTATLDVYHDENPGTSGTPPVENGDQLLIVDEATGHIRYYTTQTQNHGADSIDDGAGNLVTMVLTANDDFDGDGTPNNTANVNVQLRIDVEPTGFQVGTDAANDPTADAAANPGPASDFMAAGAILPEEVTVMASPLGVQSNPQVAARIDVQDDNMGSHAYGKYTFTSSDDRFEVVPVDAANTDGSQGILRLKTGQKLDFEAIPGAANGAGNKEIKIVVTATPESGNFDPITVEITVQVSDVDTAGGDPNHPTAPTPLGNNMVPGLEDDETGADDDDTTDDDTDDDEDGGTPAPMDALAGFVSVLDDGMF